jgi:hypothetical protein
MNITQIETNLQHLIKSFSKDTFIYELLLAYGLPKASITRLQKGNLNLSKVEGEISWKKKLFFREETEADLHLTLSELLKQIKHEQPFVIVTDYKLFLAADSKTGEIFDIELRELPKHFDLFLPYWKSRSTAMKVRCMSERMARLFDEIKKDNPVKSDADLNNISINLYTL